jgi:PAS domain S-box-containing protein
MAFMMTSESGRRYGDEEVAVADELVRKAAQLVENARVHQRLRQTEERFRVALAHSRIMLWEQDVKGRYRWVHNPPPWYGADEMLGKTNDDLFDPADAARMNALDRAVLETGTLMREEIQVSQPGGPTHHLLVSQEPLLDGSGAIAGLTGAATLINDQKRAQEELAQALGFRERMIGILGHDLRNPLAAVRVLATLLLRQEDLPEGARTRVEEIARAGERMLEMIGTLLDFTSFRFKGGLPIAPVPTDLHEVCRGVVAELVAAEPGRTIQLSLEGDGRGTWDPARMAQVVSNLVANALEHGARNGTVRVSVGGCEDDVVVEVENQGPAIAPDRLSAIFEPFGGGSALPGSSRGLGLGLYIVRQVVSAHCGAVEVHSTDRGTTFTVRLPRDAGEVRRPAGSGVALEGGAAALA